MAVPADRPIRFLQVVTSYPAYLRDFYADRPELQSAPYAQHIEALLDDGFSGCHNLSREMARAGWQAETIVTNAAPAQRKWLAEQQLTLPEPVDGVLVAAMQIQMFRPDVVYFNEIALFDSHFLRKLPTRPSLVVGWRGFGIPAGTDLAEYDVIVSSFDRTFTEAPRFGARDVQRHYPGFPGDFHAEDTPVYERDVIFSGSITGQHVSRVALLQLIWRASRGDDGGQPFGFELFMPDVSMFPAEMRALNRGSLWGNTMLRALGRSRITINIAVDGFDVQPPNMRVIEATGAGAFLMTNAHPDLSRFFSPGQELETFGNGDELIAKIRYYLAHDTERRVIAKQGHLRCLKDHSLVASAARFRAMIENKLAAKKA
ncbi:MAG: glycosyltransferase family 1 protein [Rhodospirillaceae bacterium]|nr:MAG: glycosyltransferase family 1 protein [Rhodospirillaceae bacterium]